VPEGIFQLPNEQVALFLRHLWATDGTLFLGKKGKQPVRISFATSSYTLAQDVATLLLRFGIVARIREVLQGRYRPMYTVDVSGCTDQLTFLTQIGAYGEKIEKANLLREWLLTRQPNPNRDTLPHEVFEQVRATMRNRGISQRAMAARRGTAYGGTSHFKFAPSREMLANYAAILEDSYLQTMATNDLFWDEVIGVEADGVAEVFDLSVPETHAWIANGVVSHNSGAIEQDADIVSFIYRPEYYQILEDETGQSLKGIAELIIAKHRHGALDTIKLKFIDQFAKFANLDDPNFHGLHDPLTGPFQPSMITRPSRMNEEDIPF
jgi:replicative DNA helicase